MQRRKRPQQLARIRVVGIGGGGITAVNRLMAAGLYAVDFMTIDTDIDALQESNAPVQMRIGETSAVSQGAKGEMDQGMRAAMLALDILEGELSGFELIFIVAGLGGGTGSGAAPIVARIAKEQGALVMGIVTQPFSFEGEKRLATARRGISNLRNWTDTLIVIPNHRLLEIAGGAIGFHETYRLAHDIWYQSIHGISELLSHSGLINVDFADVKAIMSEGGAAVIATGRGEGRNRARQAAEKATHSELLGITVDGAHGVLFNITGGPEMSLLEVEEAAATITRRVHHSANVIFGATVDHALGDEMFVTVIATGFTISGLTDETRTVRTLRPPLETHSLPRQPEPRAISVKTTR